MLLRWIETKLMYPAPSIDNVDWSPEGLHFEDVYFDSSDGTRLHGWFAPIVNARCNLLFCHGNGEHVGYLASDIFYLQEFLNAQVFVFDYRGYGKSQGKPLESGLLDDGQAAQLWLADRVGCEPDSIVLWGRSLGGAIAVHLAASLGTRCLVLDRTFSSMVDVASSLFPWLPVRTVLRNRYPSAKRIIQYDGPLIQVHGHADEIVPFQLGKTLFDAAVSSNKQFLQDPDLSHNEPWPDHFDHQVAGFVHRSLP